MVLDAEVSRVNDTKRSFAFSLMCKGVDEMFLAAEDDHLYEAWMARLNTASRNHGTSLLSLCRLTSIVFSYIDEYLFLYVLYCTCIGLVVDSPPLTPLTGEYSNAWTNWQSEENLAGGPKVCVCVCVCVLSLAIYGNCLML